MSRKKFWEVFFNKTNIIPKPAGAQLYECGSGARQYYVENATANTHAEYAAFLEAVGFSKSYGNTIENNSFATYTRDDQIVTLVYTANTQVMRVIMELTENTSTSLSDNYDGSGSESTTVTQIGQWYVDTSTEEHEYWEENYVFGIDMGKHVTKDFATNYNSGMGYIIRLEDGSFIIVDGGYNTETHAKNLYDVLVKQNGGEEGIVIAAWIFTHAHDDHVGAFKAFTQSYADKVTVERFIYNFPTEEEATLGGQNSPNLEAVKNAMSKYDGAIIVVAHAGQVFSIRNAKVNILFTWDMMQPCTLDYYNGCTMIFNVVAEGKTIMFLGDAGGDSAHSTNELAEVVEIYSATTLRSDILQASHHGLDTAKETEALYELIAPDYVFVPCASMYTKIDGTYIRLEERAAWKISGAEKYLAGSSVTVMTLGDTLSVSVSDNVNAYITKNS